MILEGWYNNAGFILLMIVVAFAAIGITAWGISKLVKSKATKKDGASEEKEVKKTQEEIASEELDRVLVSVDDDDTAEKIKDYKEKDE